MRGLFGILIVLAAFAWGSAPAQAQSCSFTITNIAFGNVDVTTNTTYDTTGTMNISCTNGTRRGTVRVCPNLLDGTGNSTSLNPRFMLSGANQLNYNLYQDAARTTVWGSYPAGLFTSPTIDITLNNSGAGSASATIYGRVLAAQQTKVAGSYTSSYSGTGEMSLAYANFTGSQTCASIGTTNQKSTTFSVTATNVTQCSVSANPVNFGSQGLLNADVDATGTVSLTCTNGAPYTVSLGGGNSGATNPTLRKLASGANQTTYGLYRDAARTQPWGSTSGTNTQAGTGSGLAQNYTVYGRVPVQTTPAPGAYSDSVVVTVTY
jgi:spore coat protein U-like protein